MEDYEITKVISRLVGNIQPCADSYYDGIAKENIILLGNVLDSLVCRLGNVMAEGYNSTFASEKECSQMAMNMLNNIIEHIEEYMENCR